MAEDVENGHALPLAAPERPQQQSAVQQFGQPDYTFSLAMLTPWATLRLLRGIQSTPRRTFAKSSLGSMLSTKLQMTRYSASITSPSWLIVLISVGRSTLPTWTSTDG